MSSNRTPLAWAVMALGIPAVVVTAMSWTQAGESPVKNSRFFQVDTKAKKILGPAPYVAGTLKFDLVSVTVDQPQFWPDEQVHLKVVMPGRPGAAFVATWKKRDANEETLKGKLDDGGVAVVVIMDGQERKLELGEYRVDVKTEDGRGSSHTTFAVVEGTLGGLSLAHEFKQVTSTDELDKVKGGWFLGNAGGAGKRWGNGLSFKNELRVGNQPYTGDVTYIPRCMLPGCNGVQAGPEKKAAVKDGQVWGSIDVGGHSGPFQIEFVTAKGSLRHQFEGSSHVERDMVPVSQGVGWLHRAGLAPYQGTTQVPGRPLFVEKTRVDTDPYEVESIVARDGKVDLKVVKAVKGPALTAWQPQPDGTFKAAPLTTPPEWKPGQTVSVAVTTPYVFVTVGGYVDGKVVEGWWIAFPPTQVDIALQLPPAGAPLKPVKVEVLTTVAGQPAALSGILEVFDNRVASKSPVSPLASAVGDSVRNTSNAVSSWRDWTGLEEMRRRAPMEESAEREMAKDEAPSARAMSAPKRSAKMSMPPPSPAPSMAAGAAPGGMPMSPTVGQAEEPEPQPEEEIRQGEKKVVFCDVVRTDRVGKAVVEVVLPPQLGRVTVRFVAVSGLDHASAQGQVDVSKKAAVEVQAPRVVVPGAKLQLPVQVVNTTSESVTLVVDGAGAKEAPRTLGPGTADLEVAWSVQPGTLNLVLLDGKKKVVDRRDVVVQSLGAQPVTFSRLVFSGGAPVKVGPGEVAMAYAGPGAMMKGVVMNMVTTMESWFGHAEAISAQAAARSIIVAAVSRGILDDEGLSQTLKVGIEKPVRDLAETFFDPATGLVRPYPGLPSNPLWSAWTCRNLHVVIRTLSDAKLAPAYGETIQRARDLCARVDETLRKQGVSLSEVGGYDEQGRDVIPVELDGKVVYKVVVDDAVSKWAVDKLMPVLDLGQKDVELAFSKAYDTFRFLRAFQRVGALQYLTEIAMALYANGERAKFAALYEKIARGMILAQEPGMVQGPALLGGVYSTPMALVRFLELQLMMAEAKPATGDLLVKTGGKARKVAWGEQVKVTADSTLQAPAGAIVRVDATYSVDMLQPTGREPLAKVRLSKSSLAMAEETTLTVELDASKDPLEYYAIIAVPTTTYVKQTGDILSDYRGQLIYGQQSTGSAKTQLLAVPFRGLHKLELLLEGGIKGVSPGAVTVRHVENVAEVSNIKVGEVTVK